MIQIKFIKDTELKKKGDVVSCSKKSGEDAVNNGFAEYIKNESDLDKQIKERERKRNILRTKENEEDPKLNYDQATGIILEVEGILPNLAEKSKEDGRRRANEETVRKVVNEENIKEKQKEEVKEKEEILIRNNLQLLHERKQNDFYILQMEVMKKLAEKSREGINQATEIMAEHILKKNNIYSTKDDIKSEMWIYQEGIYVPNGKSYIKEFCRLVLEKAYNSYLVNQVIAKVEADTFIDQEQFFQNKYIEEIPVQNGILNVLTRELKPYNPSKIFFNKLPVVYIPTALNPGIEKFLTDILDKEEDLTVIYEVIGSGLYKDYFTEKAVMFVGHGRNGKSKILELIKRLVGAENCCSVPIRSMNENNSSLCELYSRLFNLAGDLSGGDLKDTGVFKQTTGRDTLQTHRKYLRDLTFVNYAKHIFACNELPRVFDTTDGFWDKWVLLNFPYKFITQEEFDKLIPEEKVFHKIKDPDIINKITTPEELSGLLNKAIEGLHRLFKQKNYSQTKGTKDIKDFWIRNSDSFTAFCIDCLKEDNSTYLTKRELRKQFNIYCKKYSLKGAGDKSIKATLEDRYGAIEDRIKVNEEQTYVWVGINFKWRL